MKIKRKKEKEEKNVNKVEEAVNGGRTEKGKGGERDKWMVK